MKTGRKAILLPVVVALALGGCALFQSTVKAFEDMTPKERATWFMAVYNQEYNAYKAKAVVPEDLTELQRKIMRLKKKAMQIAWPVIKSYTSMVNSGGYSAKTEMAALDAIRALTAIVEGGPDA
jgi:hypothetical protein